MRAWPSQASEQQMRRPQRLTTAAIEERAVALAIGTEAAVVVLWNDLLLATRLFRSSAPSPSWERNGTQQKVETGMNVCVLGKVLGMEMK